MIKHLVLLCTLLFVSVAQGFDGKQKPVDVIIPFSPGGGVDVIFKHLQTYMQQKHGIKMVPVYKPGAEGMIGLREITQTQDKDGYTVGVISVASIPVSKKMNPDINVDVITGLKRQVAVVVTSEGYRHSTIEQLIGALKTSEQINIASGAPAQTLFWRQFFTNTKTEERQLINYKGGGQVVIDIVGKHVDIGLLPLSIVKPHIDAGKMVALAHTDDTANELLKNVPSLFTKFPGWKRLDVVAFVLPPNVSPIARRFWVDILQQYMYDPATKADAAKDFTSLARFGLADVNESLLEVNKFLR